MSDTSSPDDRSQEGGVRLCSPPRRARPTAAAPVTGASKGSSHKKPEVQDPDSPTPAPKNKRNDDRSNDMNAFHYQMAQGSFPNAHYPTMTTPSFGGASETSSALSYYPPGHRGYAKHIAPSGARHAMLHSAESGSSTASSSVMEGLTANMLGMELKFHDYYTVSCGVTLCCSSLTHSYIALYPYANVWLGSKWRHPTDTRADVQDQPEHLST